MDNFDYDRLGSVIANAMKGDGGGSYRGAFTGGSAKEFVERIQQYSDALKKQTSPLSRITAALTQHNEELSKTAKGLDEEYKKRLAEAKRTGTPEEVQALKTNKKQVDTQIALSGTINSLGSFKKSATDVSNAFGRIITSAGSFLQGSGNEIGAVGNVIGSLANQIPIVGGAIGSIVGILTKELEKTVEGFRDANRAGALFADGMTGLRNSANAAGLTVQQFGTVISANRQVLAESGLSVGDAARTIGNVGRVIRTSGIQTQLMNLGFSFEEQAALTADVLSTMRRANSAYMQDPNTVARAVSDYAVNLRTIAAITGEDARKKMEEAKAASSQIAVRIRLQELEKRAPGITAAYEAAMATRSQAEQKAINQMFTLGTVTDTTMNILMSNNQGVRQGIEGFVDLLRSGNTNVQDYQVLQGRANDRFRENLSGLEALGQAGIAGASGVLGDTVRLANQKLLESDKFTEEAARNAQKAAQDQKNTTDALTSATNNLVTTVQDFRVSFEREIIGMLPQFASTLSSIISGAREFVSAMGGIVQLIKEIAGGLVGALVGGLLGTVVGAVLGGMAGGPVGAMVGAALGGKLGAGAGFLIGGGATATYSPPARAAGGPVNPSSTYLVGERGPELFRPSAAGAIVPNNEISSAAGPISGELVNVMREQLEQLRQLVTKSDETTAAMSDLRSIQQQLLNNSY